MYKTKTCLPIYMKNIKSDTFWGIKVLWSSEKNGTFVIATCIFICWCWLHLHDLVIHKWKVYNISQPTITAYFHIIWNLADFVLLAIFSFNFKSHYLFLNGSQNMSQYLIMLFMLYRSLTGIMLPLLFSSFLAIYFWRGSVHRHFDIVLFCFLLVFISA